MDIHQVRREYRNTPLKKRDLPKDPFLKLESWMQEALDHDLLEANAVVLSTADKQGRPSSRAVLLKSIQAPYLLFFTYSTSRKAAQLQENPHAALTLLWLPLERQVNIEGTVSLAPRKTAEHYFSTRPRKSQLAAWATSQDTPLPNRDALDLAFQEAEKRFLDTPIPCPPHWIGYLFHPTRFEFWQGRESRLHDRFLYLPQRNLWTITRLSP